MPNNFCSKSRKGEKIMRPFICFRYFWYFLPKVPLRSGTFGTFYHFVLLRTFFGEKIATFLRQTATANAETTKSTAVERYFWYFLPKVPKLPKQMNGLLVCSNSMQKVNFSEKVPKTAISSGFRAKCYFNDPL